MVSGGFHVCSQPGKSGPSVLSTPLGGHIKKRRGFPRRFDSVSGRRDQRSSCSTLCCDWLASASADTAIDWRVDSAWLLAAPCLGWARFGLEEPVCSTLIRFFEKS